MKTKNLIKILLCLAVFTVPIYAGVSTDGLTFLKIKPSARGASLGDGFVSIVDDANAAFYNPAALTSNDMAEFSLMHMIYVADTSYEYGAVALPVGYGMKVALHVIYLNYGSIAKTTEDNLGNYIAATSNFNPNDLGVGLSLGYKLDEMFSVGITAKYAAESIDTVSTTGLMADAGILANISGVRVGIVGYNFGTVNMDKAPMMGRLGVSTKFTVQTENDLTVGAGASYSLAGNKISGSLGMEYTYGIIVGRASYAAGTDLDSLNLGAGIRLPIEGITAQVDYNFSLLGDVGQAHRISLGIKFGQDAAPAESSGDNKDEKFKKLMEKKGSSDNTPKSQKGGLKYFFKK